MKTAVDAMYDVNNVIPTPFVDFLCKEDKQGNEHPIPCQENVIRAVRSFHIVRFDTFKQKYEIRENNKWVVREDHHDIDIHSKMSNRFQFLCKQGVGMVREALTMIGYENAYDSAQDYINGLLWDEVPRLDSWLHNTYHVEDNEYHRKIGSNWVKGLVKRILVPGSKFDYALLLQGPQGIKKSTSLLAIAGDKYHVEFTDLSVKEFQQDIQGKLIVEFSEGAVFKKSEQETLKSILTRQQDTYRPPYARASRDFPRRCVFAVTANNDEILKDDTGNRRWWVVLLPNEDANVEWLVENRNQLFAEARHRLIELKESTWEIPIDILKNNQEQVRQHEQDEDIFKKWYMGLMAETKNEGVTARQAYCGVYQPRNRDGYLIDSDSVSINKKIEMSITRVFKHLGLHKKRLQQAGYRENTWFPKEPLPADYF
jgi:predicted P-loop ATPase